MKWIFENFQIVVAIVAAVAYFLSRNRKEADRTESPEQSDLDPEQAERTRRVQEEIRRKIAERRGVTAEATPREVATERIPPLMRPTQVPPVDPFGGPMRRIVREFEQTVAQWEAPPPEADAMAQAAELQRQARLKEQLQALEAARLAESQRAQELMVSRRVPMVSRTPVYATANLRGALRDPRELRRAIVLREILGTPVGLR